MPQCSVLSSLASSSVMVSHGHQTSFSSWRGWPSSLQSLSGSRHLTLLPLPLFDAADGHPCPPGLCTASYHDISCVSEVKVEGMLFLVLEGKKNVLLICCDNALFCIVLYISHVPFRLQYPVRSVLHGVSL